MFIDQPSQKLKAENKKNLIIKTVVVLLILFSVLIIIFLVYKLWPRKDIKIIAPVEEKGNPPAVLNNLGEDSGNQGSGKPETVLAAEKITFGDFYKKIENQEENLNKVNLPINIKTEVANYYDVARKVNLDSVVGNINKDGFAVLNNALTSGAADFFDAYDKLNKNGLPLLITGDFLTYYSQQISKEVFEQIQTDIFYKQLWDINKKMYDGANARYRSRRAMMGVANDQILEAERMEAAYFATALELLKKEEVKNDDDKKAVLELSDYIFEQPDYLKDYVAKETTLIKEAKKIERSPIFLYYRNYEDFKLPPGYKENLKLRKFYLATKWLNSNFPLYYKDNSCPDCLLDKYDWQVSLIAANLIAKDFSANSDLANDWAKIYKAVSYFSGLRQDLTYIHYRDSFTKLFGDAYDIEKIFSASNPSREEDTNKLQKEIASIPFSLIEGSFPRNSASSTPAIGMRMLQEPYWPNDYIFSELTFPQVGYYEKNRTLDKKLNISACENQKHELYRCRSTGLDLVNLLYSIQGGNKYFSENSAYENYSVSANNLKNQFSGFNINTWHNNIFWTNLSIFKSLLETNNSADIYFGQPIWHEKNLNTALGSWVNFQLPLYSQIGGGKDTVGLNPFAEGSMNLNYIEPSAVLADEIYANAKMLKDTLAKLNIIRDTDFAGVKLNNLISDLEIARAVIKKELKGEPFTQDDQKNILGLAKKIVVKKEGIKDANMSLLFKFNSMRSVKEDITGAKLMVIVYQMGEKKYFAVGPVFNYVEALR